MSEIKRYSVYESKIQGEPHIICCKDGEWIKASDINKMRRSE